MVKNSINRKGSKNAAFEVVLNYANKVKGTRASKISPLERIDDIDMTIIQLMLQNYTNSEIAKELEKPLSTIQRRTRKLIDSGIIHPTHLLDFKKFGLRRGIICFNCKGADLAEAANFISKIRGVDSVTAYLGSLELLANVVYADSAEVLEIIGKAQELDSVSGISWSEEIDSTAL